MERQRLREAEMILERLGNPAEILLKHLQIHGRIKVGMYTPAVPSGMTYDQMKTVLTQLYNEHLVTFYREVGDPVYEIAPGY